jgi:hypothetical protein
VLNRGSGMARENKIEIYEKMQCSGIGFFQIPGLGSQIHIFESLVTIFVGKKYL